jgi:gluconate 2-dehydrogenase gamma chain
MLLGTALAVPSWALAREYRGGDGVPWAPGVSDYPYYGRETDRFLTSVERACVDAITSRFIPSDDDGPGAREADVTTFIDRQLAGFYGRGQRWYMRGPWPEGLPTQGYQTHHTPAQLYSEAIAALDTYCREAYSDRTFAELDEAEQDAVLRGIEAEEITFEGVPAKAFFDLIHENTIEGYFCDPIYGGNRNMVAWEYVGFPGARYDYRDYIHHNGAAIEMPPVGLMGRPGWNAAN